MVMHLVVEIVLVQCRRAFVIFAHMCCCRMYRTVVHILTFAFFVVFDGVGFGLAMFSVGVGKVAGMCAFLLGRFAGAVRLCGLFYCVALLRLVTACRVM